MGPEQAKFTAWMNERREQGLVNFKAHFDVRSIAERYGAKYVPMGFKDGQLMYEHIDWTGVDVDKSTVVEELYKELNMMNEAFAREAARLERERMLEGLRKAYLHMEAVDILSNRPTLDGEGDIAKSRVDDFDWGSREHWLFNAIGSMLEMAMLELGNWVRNGPDYHEIRAEAKQLAIGEIEKIDRLLTDRKARMEILDLLKVLHNETWMHSGDQWRQHENYAKLVELGQPVVEILMHRMMHGIEDGWVAFSLIHDITGEKPQRIEHQGLYNETKSDYISWWNDASRQKNPHIRG